MVQIKADLESQALQEPDNVHLRENIIQIRSDINKCDVERAASSIFRSQCKYAREGEKCSSFFLSLEKRRYLEKNMSCVLLSDGTVCSDQKTILDEQIRFYQDLYSKDSDINFALSPADDERILSTSEKLWCDSIISIDELFDAVMTLKGGKVPGLDGITVEFYRKFWKDLSPNLMEMYQFSFNNGLLPRTVREGLISLLPKKGKDSRLVKNKRPLTLLGVDLKILSKTIDNRMSILLPELIKSQTGFVKGRKISHNVRKSLDIIEHARVSKIPAVILSIDMEKCFDRLEHTAILGSLRYFNFGDNLIQWITLLYTEFRICTQNFGILSPFWIKERGTNQGDPLSPTLYLLTAEIMANKIRHNKKIKGIKIGEIEYLLSQFADDTDLYLSFDQETFVNVFTELSNIERNTGLRVSYDKTTMYRIGSLANSNATLYTSRKVNWSNDFVNTLGIDISVDKKKDCRSKLRICNCQDENHLEICGITAL